MEVSVGRAPRQREHSLLEPKLEWCERRHEKTMAKSRGTGVRSGEGAERAGHCKDMAFTLNKVGGLESFGQKRDLTRLPSYQGLCGSWLTRL